MSELTREQWLKLGAASARFLSAHAADAATVASSVPAAIRMAKGMKDLVESVKPPEAPAAVAPAASPVAAALAPQSVAQATVAAPAKVPPLPAAKPPSAAAAPRITAAAAIAHVEQHGLAPHEQALFDRASGLSSG